MRKTSHLESNIDDLIAMTEDPDRLTAESGYAGLHQLYLESPNVLEKALEETRLSTEDILAWYERINKDEKRNNKSDKNLPGNYVRGRMKPSLSPKQIAILTRYDTTFLNTGKPHSIPLMSRIRSFMEQTFEPEGKSEDVIQNEPKEVKENEESTPTATPDVEKKLRTVYGEYVRFICNSDEITLGEKTYARVILENDEHIYLDFETMDEPRTNTGKAIRFVSDSSIEESVRTGNKYVYAILENDEHVRINLETLEEWPKTASGEVIAEIIEKRMWGNQEVLYVRLESGDYALLNQVTKRVIYKYAEWDIFHRFV